MDVKEVLENLVVGFVDKLGLVLIFLGSLFLFVVVLSGILKMLDLIVFDWEWI